MRLHSLELDEIAVLLVSVGCEAAVLDVLDAHYFFALLTAWTCLLCLHHGFVFPHTALSCSICAPRTSSSIENIKHKTYSHSI